MYEWNHSLPSGHPLTSIINTIYNQIAFRYCWILAHDGRTSTLKYFDDHVYVITYGDDNVVNVSPEVSPYYN